MTANPWSSAQPRQRRESVISPELEIAIRISPLLVE
jgi:hypothetical protein